MVVIFLAVCALAQAQGFVVANLLTRKPVAFAHINAANGHFLTDGNGVVKAEIQLPIIVSAGNYVSVRLSDSKPDTIFILKQSFQRITETQNQAFIVVQNAARLKSFYPEAGNFTFSVNSYHKVFLGSDNLPRLKDNLTKFLKVVGHPGLPDVPYHHHLFLGELVGRWDYVDPLNQKMRLLQSNSSGIDRSDLAGPTMQLNSFSVGLPEISINGSKYLNPLEESNLSDYHFQVIDTALINNQVYWQLKINPKKLHRRTFLKGYAWLNAKTGAVLTTDFTVAHIEDDDEQYLLKNNLPDSLGRIYPQYRKIIYEVKISGLPIEAVQQSWFNTRGTDSLFAFSEVVIDYDSSLHRNNKILQNKVRSVPLTKIELNTYEYYRKQAKMLRLNNTINFAQRLVYGKLNLGEVNFVLNKLININFYEGIRLGAGLESEPIFNKTTILTGYAGYGFLDARWKWGSTLAYKPEPNKHLEFKYIYEHDIREPAQQKFDFDKQMYGSESLRRLQLPEVDIYTLHQAKVSNKIGRYFYLSYSALYQQIKPNYQYEYLSDNGKLRQFFEQFEMRLSARYSYGETFMNLNKLSLSLGTIYPEVWLQYSAGFVNYNTCNCSYTKLEGKVNYKKVFSGGANFGVQLLGGIVNGNVPYPLMFNMRGSYFPASAITHNSFETMRFQEFAANRFIALFSAYSFAPRYIQNFPSEPQFILMHNMGIGALNNTDLHKGVTLKTIDKGYIESGAFISNLFKIYFGGGYLGVGIGAFYRYGPYSNNPETPNLLYKFSILYSF